MNEFTRFLETRDPAVVVREWTSANYADASLEGHKESRLLARARLERAFQVAAQWEKLTPGVVCANGHENAEFYSVHRSNGKTESRCRQCSRDVNKRHRANKKRKQEKYGKD